jgi:alkylhydroperoxidase family enzyme
MELIPKLSQNEMAPELAAMLGPRIERLGYLGEFFRYAAHQPDALMSFLRFTEDLKKALPDNLTEVVALTVAKTMNNAYERVQHERLSLRLGFGEPWLRAVLTAKAEASGVLSEPENLVQKLTLAVLAEKGHGVQPQLEAVIRAIGHQHAIAVLMLIGRYITHALIVNSLALAPPAPSPLGET